SDARVKALLESGVGEIVVSIDGATEETFQALRPPADLERVMANLARAAREGGRKIGVHAMVTRESAKELRALLERIADAGVRRLTACPRVEASVGAAVPSSAPPPAPLDSNGVRDEAESRGVEFRWLRTEPVGARLLPSETAGPGLLGDLPATARIASPEPEGAPLRALCPRPFTSVYVRADGRVGTCAHGQHHLGDLATQSLDEIFAGPAF